ncbi:MAG TPA: ATP-binding cassette domain-containing protein [Cyclobacteriaceae bacterium]
MAPIELINVSHRFGDSIVLENISVAFEQYKITGIIGRSGSGKSTLLQVINALIKPSEGHVLFYDKLVHHLNPYEMRQKMGYVVQGIGLFPHLTVEENILLNSRITKKLPDPLRVDTLMKMVSLPASFKKKYPFELSGGEQQRVGICRALFNNPPVLLMDEPFGALDSITRYEIQQEVLQLQKAEPRTILFVTHDIKEAARMADSLLVIEGGKIQQFDKKEKVFETPSNESVRKLIETSA